MKRHRQDRCELRFTLKPNWLIWLFKKKAAACSREWVVASGGAEDKSLPLLVYIYIYISKKWYDAWLKAVIWCEPWIVWSIALSSLRANNVVLSSIFNTACPVWKTNVTGDGSLSQHAMGEKHGALWTGHKSNAGLIKSHSPSNRQNKVSSPASVRVFGPRVWGYYSGFLSHIHTNSLS